MLRTRTPLSKSRRTSTARLACVRPPASVHPEPGSNSPLYVCLPLLKKKLIDALVFPYFLVVICMSMISILLALTPVACFICHAASELRVQKYELFFNWQNILEKILKLFFVSFNPPLYVNLSVLLRSRLSRFGTAKIQRFSFRQNVF